MEHDGVRRPLCLFALTFAVTAGFLIGCDEIYGLRVALVAACLFFVALCIPLLRRTAAVLCVLTAVLISSVMVYARYQLAVSPLEDLSGETVTATVRITDLPAAEAKTYRAQVMACPLLKKGTRICVSFADPEAAPSRFDCVELEARLYTPADTLRSDGIFVAAYANKATVLDEKRPWYSVISVDLRQRLLQTVQDMLPGQEGALISGVCLGDVSYLSPQVQNDFRRSGLSHLLVVSGLHMSILIGAVTIFLRQLRVPRGARVLLLLAVLWLFMLLVGFSYSVIRAGIMLHFLILADAFRWRADSLTSLSAALLVILCMSPYAITDVGFLLSFCSTFGIVLLSPLFGEWIFRRRFFRQHTLCGTVLQCCCTTVSAMLFTAPILALFFGTLPMLSVIANLLTANPVGLLLPLAFLALLTAQIPFLTFLAKGLFFLCGLLAKWVLAAAHAVGSVSVAVLQVRHPASFVLLLVTPAALYIAYRLARGRGLLRVGVAASVLALLCVMLSVGVSHTTVSVRIAGSGTALSAIVETRETTIAVISGEDRAAYIQAGRFLADCGVQSLDALVVGTADEKQVALLAQLLEETPARTVVYAAAKDWTAGITEIRRQPLETGEIYQNGDVAVRLQGGCCQVQVGDTRLLFALAADATLPAAFAETHLLVLHDTVPDWVSAVTAEQAVVVCEQEQMRSLTGRLPWGVYPIHLSTQSDITSFMTTGKGDLLAADRYWL